MYLRPVRRTSPSSPDRTPLPQPPLEHRFRRAPAAPVQPVFKVLHPDDVRHLGVPDLDGDGRQPASDIADPVVNVQGGEGMGDGFVKGLRRHVERVLCFCSGRG
jgi:hypothetical protein